MSNKTEQELRNYLKTLPYSKRTRVIEYMHLRDIINARHSEDTTVCDNCGHRCHMFAEYGICCNGNCSCHSCYCNRCDLEYGMVSKAC